MRFLRTPMRRRARRWPSWTAGGRGQAPPGATREGEGSSRYRAAPPCASGRAPAAQGGGSCGGPREDGAPRSARRGSLPPPRPPARTRAGRCSRLPRTALRSRMRETSAPPPARGGREAPQGRPPRIAQDARSPPRECNRTGHAPRVGPARRHGGRCHIPGGCASPVRPGGAPSRSRLHPPASRLPRAPAGTVWERLWERFAVTEGKPGERREEQEGEKPRRRKGKEKSETGSNPPV